MTKLKSLLLLVMTLLAGHVCLAQLTSAEIDALVTDAMDKFKVAGVAVAVVKDGKVVHEKGYGVRSIGGKEPVDPHTNFQIASNSKAFTSAALAILIDEGKLSWKDKVKKYIPEFRMYNEYVTEHFMIEDLLCHRSGLGLGAGDLMFIPDGSDFTINDVVTAFQYFKPVSAFRTQYDYDNLLYFVAGEVIARASGMSWDQFIRTRIMDPLQMSASYPSVSAMTAAGAVAPRNLAMPHSTENVDGSIRQIALYGEMINAAAGGILSNVHDMSKWVIMQLSKGKYGSEDGTSAGKQLFSERRQKEMWKIHTVYDANPDPRLQSHFAGYGLGWGLFDIKGNMSVSHTGGLPGMLSKVSLIPDLGLGIIILTNTENGGGALFNAVHNTIQDSYLGLDRNDYVQLFHNRLTSMRDNADSVTLQVWNQVEAAKTARINPQDYLGIYEDNWFGKIEVSLKDGQLWFSSYRSPKLNGPMYFYKANTFAVKWEYRDMNCDAFAIFGLDENGRAHGIRMKGISPNIDFSFDFQDLDLRRIK